ncbi:MAG TPA: DUF3014 domain-containing protein [Steroidobacteraceae bacterium]|nr:DUF3014 domain-containing protein [Steroidobacteraceae bacterium]
MTSEKPIIWGAAAVVVVAAGALYYFYYVRHGTPVAVPAHVAPAPVSQPSEPAIENPVPAGGASASAAPLPALNDSDVPLRDALTGIPGGTTLEKFLNPQNLVRHIVATVDNLPRKRVAVELRPIKPTSGQFLVSGAADHLTESPDNFQRYTPVVDMVKSLDANKLAAIYFHFYPLFQQAYEDLGYPTEYFNDRVIEVIDHLLQTPDVHGPIALVQPNVMYLYADPKLEALSAGQKTLIRMGGDNEAVIKAKLKELRDLLAAHGSASAAAPASASASAPAAAH